MTFWIQLSVYIGCVCLLASCATPTGPLATLPMVSPTAAQHNLEGIDAYNNGQWAQAQEHFESAIHADPTLPEVHFNLGLSLHKLGKHLDATQHFTKAGELSPESQAIIKSSIYRHHLGLSSTFERHISGGYRY